MRNIIFSMLLLLFGFQASAMAFTPAVDAELAVQELSIQSYHQTGDVDNIDSVGVPNAYREWAVMGLPLVYETSILTAYLGQRKDVLMVNMRRRAQCSHCRPS